MEERLAPYDLWPDSVLDQVSDPYHLYDTGPWAVVLLDREYKLSEWVNNVRYYEPPAFAMTNYTALSASRSGRDVRLTQMSVLVIRKPSDLYRAPEDGGLFSACKDALQGFDPCHSWLTLLDALPSDWVASVEAQADDDFEAYGLPLPRPLGGRWYCW